MRNDFCSWVHVVAGMQNHLITGANFAKDFGEVSHRGAGLDSHLLRLSIMNTEYITLLAGAGNRGLG